MVFVQNKSDGTLTSAKGTQKSEIKILPTDSVKRKILDKVSTFIII